MKQQSSLILNKMKGYLFYLPQKTYQKLNSKYNGKILPNLLIEKITADILGDRINKISVIITTRNRLDALKNYSLPSLERLNFKALPYEIVIVDNNSNDGTYSYLQEYQKKNSSIKVFQEKKIGSSVGRNKGIENSNGELLVFMDDDCEVDEYWLNRIYRLHCQNKFFVGQGQIYDQEMKELMIKEEGGKIDFFKIGNMAGGNMSVRRKVFDYVSFNENIRFFHEDKDLISQIKIFWPDFSYFIDEFPINHYRAPSEYRNKDGLYTPKSIRLSVKMYNLSYLSEYILRRNLDLDSLSYDLRFILRELFFLPLELFFVDADILLLLKIKMKSYRQLKRLVSLL